jgi:UDP-glucose 4-epimerase
MTNKKILVTGAKGFLGSNIVKHFKLIGYETYGVGHGILSIADLVEMGLDYWKQGDISITLLSEFSQLFDLIVHCGGGGSVGFSMEHPYYDFKKTVDGTLEVLEYMRLYNPNAHLIYPSSPAVQGEHPKIPITEEYIGKPVSPYGYHKKITEDLCKSYSEKFGFKISVIRLFSVYGIGLKKQILWDAYHKINKAKKEVEFWGTGTEIRDFIHVDDVISIIKVLLKADNRFTIINGGTGENYTIHDIIEKIKLFLNKDIEIKFNQNINLGNPEYYCADTTKLKMLGIDIFKDFEKEVKQYINWIDTLGELE